MYFTDEEKEIIKKIAKKNRYSIDDFFKDNFIDREKIELKEQWNSYPLKGFYTKDMIMDKAFLPSKQDNEIRRKCNKEVTEVYDFKEEYIKKIDVFIKVWNILKECKFTYVKSTTKDKVILNFRNFGSKKNEQIIEDHCKDYEDYSLNEFIVIVDSLSQFIKDDFKTKDEIHMEKTLKSADNSFKVSLWIAGISIFLSVLSIGLSVFTIVKESEVKVKNLNDIKIEKLEKQLEITNKELGGIKGLLNQKKKI